MSDLNETIETKTPIVNIYPIFNQAAPNVWNDLIRVRGATMNYQMDTDAQNAVLQNLKQVWKNRANQIVFGAYADNEMIGYVRGVHTARRGVTEITELFVVPEFQSQMIGARLLSCIEISASMDAKKLEVWAPDINSGEYFARRGFKAVEDAPYIHFEKKLSNMRALRVQPVFFATKKLTQNLQNIAKKSGAEFNPDVVNKLHAPTWVYVMHEVKMGSVPEIRGFVTDNAEKPTTYVMERTSPMAGVHMMDALQKQRTFQITQANAGKVK